MYSLILHRILQSVFVMMSVAFIAFAMFRFAGDPITQMVGQETSIEDQEQLRDRLGLNDPVAIQFVRFTKNIITGNFGYSFRTRQPIGEMIKARLPATIELSVVSLIISLLVGIPAGIYTAIHPDRLSASTILLATLVGVSLPTFVIGISLIYLFGAELRWLPTFGRGETIALGWWKTSFLSIEGWRALILPSITLGVYQLTLTLRLVRSEMMDVMRSDYINFTIARGLPWRSIHYNHALRNTMVPVVTIIGLQFGGIVAFAVVTESVFQWPGLGLLFLESIQFVDIPVMSVYLVMIALLFVVVNLVVDILYAAIDPRIRVSGARE
ncbi:MAG: ABC transporter permease [Hyphomicrobiaceae bacterium]